MQKTYQRSPKFTLTSSDCSFRTFDFRKFWFCHTRKSCFLWNIYFVGSNRWDLSRVMIVRHTEKTEIAFCMYTKVGSHSILFITFNVINITLMPHLCFLYRIKMFNLFVFLKTRSSLLRLCLSYWKFIWKNLFPKPYHMAHMELFKTRLLWISV